MSFGERTTEMNAQQKDLEDPAAAAAAAVVVQADDAGLLKRTRIFLEAIVKMVSTVFLAACVSLAKMDMRDHSLVRGFLSGVAGGTLVVALLSLVLITLPNPFPEKLYHRYILLIHCCGLLLMVVGYLIVRLISEDYHDLSSCSWLPLAVFGTFTVIWWGFDRFKVLPGGAFKDVHQEKHLENLENWVDFSGAITFLLFLGLGALLIGGQYRTVQLRIDSLSGTDKEAQETLLSVFSFIIYLSISVCMAGVFFMLVFIVLVPPVPHCIYSFLHVVNNFFGGSLALIVLLITLGTIESCWCKPFFYHNGDRCLCSPSVAFVLSALPYILWLVLLFQEGSRNQEFTHAKTASLDLTKATCTGFLAISAYTISQKTQVSIGNSYSWFIFFTAIAICNFICWRLFTHHKKPSAASFTAANCAFLCAHVYAIAAVIPFAFMAYHTFNKKTSTDLSCHAPSPAPL